jgi:hypothetical protein
VCLGFGRALGESFFASNPYTVFVTHMLLNGGNQVKVLRLGCLFFELLLGKIREIRENALFARVPQRLPRRVLDV